jgi:NADH-quinone oxidoreductase subunit J
VSVTGKEEGLGHLLMGEYLLPFEVASIVILAALLGAVVIARKETR